MLQNVPDPRGKQGQDYFLWSILGLIVVSLLCGRRGMLAAFHLGRSLNKRQRLALGFTKGVTPCHAMLTETLRAIDGRALAQALGAVCCAEGEDQRHIAIDGKTMRASKDGDGQALQISPIHAHMDSEIALRGKGVGKYAAPPMTAAQHSARIELPRSGLFRMHPMITAF
jgi:hypothetical protein